MMEDDIIIDQQNLQNAKKANNNSIEDSEMVHNNLLKRLIRPI
jgi:hypothetical protein